MARQTNATVAAPAPASPKAARITSCGAYVKAHEADAKFAERLVGRSVTCKRLPMHKGDCRTTLHEAPKAAVKSAKRKVSGRSKARVTRTDAFAAIAAEMAAGKITADQALAKAAAFVTRASRPKAAKAAASAE
jgi:hypothetical protein